MSLFITELFNNCEQYHKAKLWPLKREEEKELRKDVFNSRDEGGKEM